MGKKAKKQTYFFSLFLSFFEFGIKFCTKLLGEKLNISIELKQLEFLSALVFGKSPWKHSRWWFLTLLCSSHWKGFGKEKTKGNVSNDVLLLKCCVRDRNRKRKGALKVRIVSVALAWCACVSAKLTLTLTLQLYTVWVVMVDFLKWFPTMWNTSIRPIWFFRHLVCIKESFRGFFPSA